MQNWIIKFVMTRLLQPSSIASYALAIVTALHWSSGQTELANVLNAIAALLLFVINEKPWGHK